MKRLIVLIRGHFIPAAFIVLLAAGTLSTGADFAADIVASFIRKKPSVSYLMTASWKKIIDVRNGDVTLAPSFFLNDINIYIYGLTQQLLGNDYVYDADPTKNTVRMQSGDLTTVLPKLTDDRLSEITGGITEFSSYLNDKGVPFLYVQLPFKVCPYDSELPGGVKDYSNENADAVLSTLQANSVNTFDIRAQYQKAGFDWYSLFFRTDRHWTPSTALWTAQCLCGELNADYSFSIDTSLLDISRFSQTTYPNLFLGSLGKRVGRFYAGMDDFTLVLPKYKTDMSYAYRDVYDRDLTGEITVRKGTFEDACIFKTYLTKDLMNNNTYVSYSMGDFPEAIYINNNIPDGKILLIRDSFGCAGAPFLSLAACHALYALDLRHFSGSVADYAQRLQPDIVIVMLNPSLFPADGDYRYDFISGQKVK